MTSIDELFKKSGIPSKRKFEPVRDPNEIYKAVRLSGNGSHSRNGNARQVHIDENDQDEAGPARPPADGADNDGDDGDYGPAAPPADDDEPGDDDEGRFFGSGMSRTEATIMDYVEGQDAGGGSGGKEVAEQPPAPETYDAAWLRRTVLGFERRINRNAELRARYEAEPAKFIASEAELDAEIKALSILGEHPELYPEFVRLGSVTSLVGLLAHENTDIAISAIEIVGELTDEDVDATDEQWNALVAGLLDADLIGLLVSNLDRLDEDADEADRTGVYYAMGIVENLSSTRGGVGEQDEGGGDEGEEGEVGEEDDDKSKGIRAASALGAHEGLVRWLLRRVQRASSQAGVPAVTQNRQYAAEVLAILAQAAPENRQRLVAQDAVDTLLQLVAAYRRRDPEKGSDEEEYMENLFEALTCLVDDAGGKQKFADAEGVELCLLLFAAGNKKSLTPALRLLDHAAGVGDGDGATAEAAADVCRRIVDAGGLKAVFTLFMRGEGHHSKKHGKGKKKAEAEQTLHGGLTAEHLVNIFASMLRLLAAESAERIRLLAKFVEKDYAKVERLLGLRQEYSSRVKAAEQRFGDGDEDGDEAERLAQRLDAGLFTRQTIDVILAWLVAEDDGARRKIRVLLADGDETLATLRLSLQERRDGIDPDVADGRDTQEMLSTLMDFLDG